MTAGGGRARRSGGEGRGSDEKICGQGSSGGFGGWVPCGLHAAGGKPLAACASLRSPGGRSEARPPPPYGFKARLNSHPSGESCLSPHFSVRLPVRPSPLPALAEQLPHPSGFCSGRGGSAVQATLRPPRGEVVAVSLAPGASDLRLSLRPAAGCACPLGSLSFPPTHPCQRAGNSVSLSSPFLSN